MVVWIRLPRLSEGLYEQYLLKVISGAIEPIYKIDDNIDSSTRRRFVKLVVFCDLENLYSQKHMPIKIWNKIVDGGKAGSTVVKDGGHNRRRVEGMVETVDAMKLENIGDLKGEILRIEVDNNVMKMELIKRKGESSMGQVSNSFDDGSRMGHKGTDV
ncbi:hypothetical protein Godav_020958, partial [Gossypium davidsonii]|nr:hypothetical protein [Gossypium davidsonii]